LFILFAAAAAASVVSISNAEIIMHPIAVCAHAMRNLRASVIFSQRRRFLHMFSFLFLHRRNKVGRSTASGSRWMMMMISVPLNGHRRQ
jgi:hypothetical protein